MDDRQLGTRLRALREARKRSLRSVAREAGIALSFVAAVEKGRNSISVAKLKTLLDALGSNLGAFFGDAAPPASKVVYRKNELVEISGQRRGLSYREVAAGRPGRALQVLVESYAPGADTGAERYRHEAEEAGVVLKGRLELTVDDEVHVLGPGDAYYFDSRRPHRFRNAGKGVVQAVSVNTPPSF
ncbi:MAG: cupin domain-containing protein [Planctomycetota bacterium]|nr:cupin domain-containing protein [Planctomycetota bacterium]